MPGGYANPSIIQLPDGSYVITTASSISNKAVAKLFHVSADGREILATSFYDAGAYQPTVYLMPPKLVAGLDGEFILLVGGKNLIAQRFSAFGETAGLPTVIGPPPATGNLPYPAHPLAYAAHPDGAGGFIVVWTDQVAADDTDIRFQHFARNDLPTGQPVLPAETTQGEVLSPDLTQIIDPNGIDTDSFTYVWLRNGKPIAGATAATLQLTEADVGHQIAVQVSFTDATGATEIVISDQTNAVHNLNDAPQGVPLLTGNLIGGQILRVDLSGLSDADGLGSFSYQWLRNGVDIDGSTDVQRRLTRYDVGQEIALRISYTDGHGTQEAVVTAPTAPIAGFPDLLLRGTAIANVLEGENGDDTLLGRGGDDTLNGRDSDDLLSGDLGDDQLYGGTGDDTLLGGFDYDLLQGAAGNDRLYGGFGTDLLSGGNHADTLSGGLNDDRLFGGRGADNLSGGDDADTLRGGEGDDRLFGGAGDDRLDGDSGVNRLTGGDGADAFVFNDRDAQTTITDFALTEDRLLLSRSLWSAQLDPAGVIAEFGTVEDGNMVLRFGSAVLVLTGITDAGALAGQIDIL